MELTSSNCFQRSTRGPRKSTICDPSLTRCDLSWRLCGLILSYWKSWASCTFSAVWEMDVSSSCCQVYADIFRLVLNRQPEKALPYFLQIRKPNVFDLIRDYNLFTTIQSQALQLVDFDQERVRPQEADEERNAPSVAGKHGRAIELLVEHTHSIPVRST